MATLPLDKAYIVTPTWILVSGATGEHTLQLNGGGLQQLNYLKENGATYVDVAVLPTFTGSQHVDISRITTLTLNGTPITCTSGHVVTKSGESWVVGSAMPTTTGVHGSVQALSNNSFVLYRFSITSITGPISSGSVAFTNYTGSGSVACPAPTLGTDGLTIGIFKCLNGLYGAGSETITSNCNEMVAAALWTALPPLCSVSQESVDGLTITVVPTFSSQNENTVTAIMTWGDGTTESCVSGESISHTYAAAGSYGIYATATETATGTSTQSSPTIVFNADTPPNVSCSVTVQSNNKTIELLASASDIDAGDYITEVAFHPHVTEFTGENSDIPVPPTDGWVSLTLIDHVPQAFTYEYTQHLVGDVWIAVRATDTEGTVSYSYQVITIENIVPTGAITVASINEMTATYTFDFSDEDGAVVEAVFTPGYGMDAIDVATTKTCTVVYDHVAVYATSLQLIDDDGSVTNYTHDTIILSLSGDWEYTLDGQTNTLSVNSGTLAANDSSPFTVSWDWDGEATTTGLTSSYQFQTLDTFHTVTATITLANGARYVIAKEIKMAASTISGLNCFIVGVGKTLDILGTGFEAAQATGTVKIGLAEETAVELTNVTWADGKISGTIPTNTPVGDVKVFITPATNTASSHGVYVTGPDAWNTDELRLGTMSRLYIDGVHAGYLQDTAEIQESAETKDFTPNDRYGVVKTFIIKSNVNVKFTISQVNAKNLAIGLCAKLEQGVAGTSPSVIRIKDKPVKLDGSSDEIPSYTIAWTDAAGVNYFIPKMQIVEPTNIVLNAQDNMNLPISGRAVADENQTIVEADDVVVITFPIAPAA